jgi:hypothetical protein
MRSPALHRPFILAAYKFACWGEAEEVMSLRSLTNRSIAALAGASMLAVSLSPASALTIAGPSLTQSVASAQIDKVWWRGGWGWGRGWGWRGGWGYRGWGWRGPGWGWRGYGWGPAAVVGGVAAGAVVGSAIAGPGYYAPGYYAPGAYGPCWRYVAGAYGRWEWRRVC